MAVFSAIVIIGSLTNSTVHAGTQTQTTNYTVIALPASSGTSTTNLDLKIGESCSQYVNTYLKMSVKNNTTDVQYLQIFLNKYFHTSTPVTGYFGPLTKSAVIKYQKANNISQTGIVLQLTRWSINNSQCPYLNFPKPKGF